MIILVGNLKGGTGKSTIAFNLAVWSAYQQRRTLLVDADPQHTTSDLITLRREEGHQPMIYSVVAEERRLGEELNKIENIFENILVDIAAGDRESFRAALKVADRLLIPLLPGQADVWALHNVMELVTAARVEKPSLEVIAVINRADTNIQVRETQETEEALRQIGLPVSKVQIGNRVTFRRSLTEGLGVMEWEPRSRAAKEMEILAQEVLT
ncbi:Chromosome partitioning protein [Gammaproteobacteria bacterium]